MPKPRRRYAWPASRLSAQRDVMHSLHLESLRTGMPITRIIEYAVCTHLEQQLEHENREPAPIGFATASQPQQTVA